MTIQMPLRLLSAGLCESAEVLDDGQLLVVGAPRIYSLAPDAGSFDLAPLSAFFVFTQCDPGEYMLRWHLAGPMGVSLHTQSQAQLITWLEDMKTNCAVVNLGGVVTAAHNLRPGVYEVAFEIGGRPLARLGFLVEIEGEEG
ncbi:MAG: hypothetical protein GEU75_01295 [Dehalococcoidia bacterium]|nr:hypothetical protein [Dehalococcoidia bacterium]